LYRSYGDDGSEQISNTEQLDLLLDSGLVYQKPNGDILFLMIEEIRDVLQRFNSFLRDPQKFARDISSWSPVIRLIYLEVMAMRWGKSDDGALPTTNETSSSPKLDKFKRSIPSYFYYPAVGILSATDRPELRGCLQQFMERIGGVMETDEFIKLL
jgi:hypothetical protein